MNLTPFSPSKLEFKVSKFEPQDETLFYEGSQYYTVNTSDPSEEVIPNCVRPSTSERMGPNLIYEKQMAKAMEWNPFLPEIPDKWLNSNSKQCVVVYFILKNETVYYWNGFYLTTSLVVTPNVTFQTHFTMDDVEHVLVNCRGKIDLINVEELIVDEFTYVALDIKSSGPFLLIETTSIYGMATVTRNLAPQKFLNDHEFVYFPQFSLEIPKWCVCMGHTQNNSESSGRCYSLSFKNSMGMLHRDKESASEFSFGTYLVCNTSSEHSIPKLLPGSLVFVFDKKCRVIGYAMHVGYYKRFQIDRNGKSEFYDNKSVCLLLDDNIQSLMLLKRREGHEQYYSKL